jgi:pilus assembly protein Flp/PilA
MELILKTQEWMKKLFHKEDGVTAIEYGLIAGLIAVIIIASVTNVGQQLLRIFNLIVTRLTAIV